MAESARVPEPSEDEPVGGRHVDIRFVVRFRSGGYDGRTLMDPRWCVYDRLYCFKLLAIRKTWDEASRYAARRERQKGPRPHEADEG